MVAAWHQNKNERAQETKEEMSLILWELIGTIIIKNNRINKIEIKSDIYSKRMCANENCR